jgi:hypothetical protein
MSEVRVKISQVVESQLPRFVKEEFPLVVEFLKQYYRSFEFQSGSSDLLQKIDQYIKIDQLANLTESTSLTSDVSFVDDEISVSSTYGFPDSYGLILIDDEIITYTSKTSTKFQGCIRGFSGVTSYDDPTTTDQLIFSTSEVAEHTSGSEVTNLSILFLKEFFNKLKKQVSPGFESRSLYSSLNDGLFVKQSKDFYSSKGTDASFKILFGALYGKDVEVIRPRDYLIQPSDAQYRITKDLVVEAIDGDPMDLINKTLYQDYDGFFKKAEGTISKVERIVRGEKEYYIISLDYDYDKDINVSGTVLGEFSIHPTTQLVDNADSSSTTIEVDSTVGFPPSGTLIAKLSNGTSLTITYTEKSLNQFYGCSGITQKLTDGQLIRLDAFAYGYATNTTSDKVKVRVTGVLSDIDILDKTFLYQRDDLIKIKCLGANLTDYKSNNWFYNVSTRYDVKTIQLLDSSDFTYRVNLYDSHNFSIGDSITLIRSDDKEFTSIIVSEEITSTSQSSVISLQNRTSFVIKGQGELDTTKFYTIRKNILKVNSSNYSNLAKYTANVQNTYTDLDETLYVASSSLPNYLNQAINIIDRSVTFSGTFSGTDLNIGIHNFYTGDIIVYNPESSSNKLDLLKGIYFVKKVDETTIKLARSRENIFTNNFISVSGTVTNNKFYFYKFSDDNLNFNSVENQKLIRKLSPAKNDVDTHETIPGSTGIFINGVELLNYKSEDLVYYGQIESINVLSQGNGYDVINPPVLTISDDIGSGSSGYCSVVGSLDRIEVIDPGFDYLEDPIITVSGGNGSGALVKANLVEFDHFVQFNSTSPAGHVNIANNTVGFSSYHKFRSAEKVIYNSQGGTDVGGLSNGAFYYVSIQDAFTVKLHNTLDDAVVGINTIDLTSYGTGIHKLSSIIKKKKLGSITVLSSGTGYQNKKVTTLPIGINTASSVVTISNHGFENGELISYQTTGSTIGGLSTSSNYYVTKVSDSQFRLSAVGISTELQSFYFDTKQYIDFTSTGSGTHIFNYPDISIEVKDRIGVSTLSGQNFSAVLQPIFRGSINSVFVENGGTNYGSEEILNYERQPSFTLTNGSGAEVLPIVSNGKIVEVLVVNGGSGYNSVPNLTITGTGTGAQLTPVVSEGILSEVKVISGGNGYSSTTFVTVTAAGSEAKFGAQIKSWRINLVERLISSNQIPDDDGIIAKSLNQNFGLEYAHAYAPRKLRSSVLAKKFKDGNPIFIPDIQVFSGVEILSDAHSPIIGWAYDGNPIYGPYGYSTPSGGVIKCLKPGYSLALKSNRPSSSIYPSGIFIDDYEFTGSGDLDKYNGRFCITPEYPNGIYAYFCTINSVSADTSGTFKNYRRPLFPYAIGNEYKSKPIDFNFQKSSNQDEIDINKTGWLRNTTPYNATRTRSYYDYIIDPNKIKKQLSVVKGTTKGSISSIGIITGGNGYQIDDQLIFDNKGTNGSGLNAKVSTIGGKQISQIGVANSTVYNVEFVPYGANSFIGFATQPHAFLNNDIVTISSSLDYQKSGLIGISTNTLILTSGIGTTTSTGSVAYFQVSGLLNYPNIRENDIYQIGNEQVQILNIDNLSSRIKVLRNINNGAGLSTYFAGTTLTEVTRKLQLTFGISTSYQYDFNKEFYFDPAESVGLGTTAGPGIGYTLSFANPGAGITQINIPTRAIYLPNHQLKTGTPLIYSSNGGTPISISTNGIASFQIPENSVVYAAKISSDLIGISTIKVGLGTTGSFIGIGSTVANIAYLTNIGVGNTHSFTTVFSNTLVAQVSRNQVTVSTATTHGLQTNDTVYLEIKPTLTKTVVVKYDDYNRRLVVNPQSFVSGNVDLVNDAITLTNHQYVTGEKIIHTSSSPCGGLANEEIYYAIVVDENKIKLAKTYYDATKPIPNIIGISTSSFGTISQINPQIKLTKNYNLTFDVSDSSLSFFNNGVQYSAFDLNFYTDPEFKNVFDSTESSSSFEIVKSGSIGITTTATVTIKTNDVLPSILYYSLDPINLTINDSTKSEIIRDDELLNHNQILLESSVYSGKFNVTNISNTKFAYTVLEKPEASQYTSIDGLFDYYTNSPTAFGRINSVSITSKGRNYQKVPKVIDVSSDYGTGAVLLASSSGIGSITNVEIQDIGFDYPSDLSLQPTSKLPEILKIESLSSFKSIGISSVGKNYTIAPNLVVIDSVTNKVVSDVDLKYNIGDSKVTILKNTKGISNVTPKIIPTNNINGVGISTIKFIDSTKDVVVTLGASFSNAADFPFNIGDKVLIESISVGVGSTAKGYNSENYNYALFTVVNTDPNIGGIGATVSYNLSNYLSSSQIPGTFDPINSYGRIIPEKHFPIFDIQLEKNQFYIGENIYSETASGSVLSWEDDSSYLKVATELDFAENQIVFGESSNSQGRIEKVIKFDSLYNVKSSSIVKKGWNSETGFLDNNFQRTHDNDYYQYFSYALRSEVSLDTWNDAVSDLNHTAGFKKFSDLIVESSPEFSGISTNQNNGDFTATVDINTVIDTNCIFDFDLAKENNIFLNNKTVSNEITFNSKIIQDYIESIGNRVLMIDDLSPQFNSSPRSTEFSIVDTFSVDAFDSNAYRFRKYIALVTDRFTITDQEMILVSLLHNNVNGYLNQYGRVETLRDLGSFDFLIAGTEANLLFYPNYYSVNNYDVSLASYNLKDSITGIGTVSLGNSIVLKTSTKNIPIGTSTPTTIVGIASTYRASKLLIQIEASDKSYFEVDEVTVIHNGTDATLLEYGQITTDTLTPLSSSGIGTYNATISGSNLNISLTPNSGLGTDYNVNAFIVSIGNTSSSTTGSQTITDSIISSTITSIASSTSPTATSVAQYSSDYFGAYYIAVVEDKTNNQYQISELVSVSNSSNTSLTEFAVLQTGSSVGSFSINNTGSTNLYFTPIANANVEVRVYQHTITNIHDSSLTKSIDLVNGSIDSIYGTYTGTEIDVRKSFYLTYKNKPIFERYIVGSASTVVNTTTNKIRVPQHFFVTGEEISYTYTGAGTSTTNAIGIGSTVIPGIGSTDKLPSTLYVVKSSEIDIQVAASASEALRTPPNVLTLSSVGIGTSHVLRSKNQNAKVLIGIDNVIQSPIVSTSVTTTLVHNVEIIDSSIYVAGITSFFAGDIVKIDNELMRLTAVGFGTTNNILVDRQWMGSGLSTHASGSVVTKVLGNYNIVNNVINFSDAPYGEVPFPNPSNRPDEQDYIGLSTSSTFSGRVFLKSGNPGSLQESYYNNYIFDDISNQFNATNKDFTLKSNSQNITGVSTSNAIILINSIFQQPRRLGAIDIIGDYSLNESSGITTISFTGAASSIAYDVNTASVPRGGVIVSVGSTAGFGYQPLVSAGGTAIVSVAGTISAISIGNSGSGYRSGLQTVKVGVAISSTGIPNITYVGVATVVNGHVTGVAITNPGVGYTTTNPPIVIFDTPLSYSNVPLIYSSSSKVGVGTETTVDIIVGQGSSIINFEIKNIGHSYGQGEILTVAIGGTVGIPTNTSLQFKEFQISVDRTFTDSFSGWSVGDLQVFDSLDSLFDGERKDFPLSIDGQQTSIRAKKGSNIDIQATLLVFVNDILQVPGTGYIFNGGSIITFPEPPKSETKSKIIFYKGNSAIDVEFIDILETVKVGDNLTLTSDNSILSQNERLVTQIKSSDTVLTNLYDGPGISVDTTLLRPITWCKQTEDMIINGQRVGKDRDSYESLIQPTTNIIQNVGINSTEIFVESVKTFFDNASEYASSENQPKKILITSQDTLVAAAATAVVSAAGTISSIVISDGGARYTVAPDVTIENPVGLGSTQRASAVSSITSGIVTTISVTSPGTGYTSTNPPLVLIGFPTPTKEVITGVSYAGDFGVITGIKTTSVGVASTGLVLDLFIPTNSFLRNTKVNSVGIATTGVSGIQTGYYFTIFNSNVGSAVTSLRQNGTVVGYGTQFIDNIYEVAAVSIAQTSVPGIGVTYVAKVTVSLQSYNGISGIGFSNFYGEYSWGRITNLTRPNPKAFTIYNNGLAGINTSPVIQRVQPLKYRNYNT